MSIKFLDFRRLLLIISFFIFTNHTNAQIVLNGKVMSSTKEEIPFAHIRLSNYNLGTSTNEQGEFRLVIPTSLKDSTIIVSCIGYNNRTVLFDNCKLIILQENTKVLSNVVIIPKDYAKELIEKAIKNIPKNYPKVTEHHFGFFRESVSMSAEEDKPFYIVEATLESIKKSYKKPKNDGQVKLLKSRKITFNSIDSLDTKFIAGTHHIHRFDIVARKEEFLGKPNKYSYSIQDTLIYNNEDLFKIEFRKKNKVKGHVYILDKTYAIVKASFVYTPPYFPHRFILLGTNRKSLEYSISYSKGVDGKWRFSQSSYLTSFGYKIGNTWLKSNYITTNTLEDSTTFPYLERIQYTDVVLEKVENYDTTFWNNFNILLPSKFDKKFFKNKMDANKSTSQLTKNNIKTDSVPSGNKFKEFWNRTRTSFFLKTSLIDFSGFSISYTSTDLNFSENRGSSISAGFNFSSSLEYPLKNNYWISILTGLSISKHKVRSIDAMISKYLNLNPNGRPFYFSPALGFGYQWVDYFLMNVNHKGDYTINNEKFDSGSIDVYLSERGLRITPTLGVAVEKNSLIDFFGNIGYSIPLGSHVGLEFVEDDEFFLTRNSTLIKNEDSSLSIKNYKKSDILRMWELSLGVRIKF